MKNEKGFSLIELIGMIVILGILMVITVPNIAGILKNNRENIVVEDFAKLASNAKTKMNTKQAQYPRNGGSCVVLTLAYLDSNHDLKSGLNGGVYNRGESFVVVKKERDHGNTFVYKYYVRLVEDVERSSTTQKYEIELTEQQVFAKDSKKYLKNLPPNVTGDMSTASLGEAKSIIDNIESTDTSGDKLVCDAVENIYTS